MIVISHNLADVFEVADRIAVLRLGRMATVLETVKTTHEEVVGAITGASRPADRGDPAVRRSEASQSPAAVEAADS